MNDPDKPKTEATYSHQRVIVIVLAVLAVLAVGEVAMKVHAVEERHRHGAMVQPPDMAKENAQPSQADQPASPPPQK